MIPLSVACREPDVIPKTICSLIIPNEKKSEISNVTATEPIPSASSTAGNQVKHTASGPESVPSQGN